MFLSARTRIASGCRRLVEDRWLLAIAGYVALGLIAVRGDFGTSGSALPQGTNALNTYTIFEFQQQHGLTVWLAPYTDWGQPLPLYPGLDPQNLLALSNIVTATEYIRAAEFCSIVVAGLSTFWAVTSLGGSRGAAISAGGFYVFLAETPEFFEGHVPAMISVALAPAMIGLAIRVFCNPTRRAGLALAATVFLSLAIGDLGSSYRILFFISLIAVASIAFRILVHPYQKRELLDLGLSGAVLSSLLAPWLVVYLAGVRPEFTTGVTTVVIPFSGTTGQPMFLSFIGFAGDNSYTLFHLGSFTYALDYSTIGLLFLLVPSLVAVYVAVFGRTRERLLYGGGLLALVFSTGPIYPSLRGFNQAAYNNIPLFDTDSTLFHWNILYTLVLSLLLGTALSHASSWISLRLESTQSVLRRDLGAPLSRRGRPGARRTSRWSRRLPASSAIMVSALLVGVVAIAAVQNWEVLSEPPGLFDFPQNYTAAYDYVASQPPDGGVLNVPFGNLYERTPWGGVSASSQLIAGLGTDRNVVTFEAGTAESLLLDRLFGDGLGEGDSNNLTKMLNATSVQYVVSTDYPNWDYASDPVYNPETTLEGLGYQLDLGTPVFRAGYQSVYRVPAVAGNVTVFPEYYVYDGGEPLLFEILNQPWYNGSQALVCLCDLDGAQQSVVLEHSGALIASPASLETLSSADWTALARGGVPIVLLAAFEDFTPNSVARSSSPWIASNGQAFTTLTSTAPAISQSFFSLLSQHGYQNLSVTARAAIPPGAIVAFGTGSNATETEIRGPGPSSLTPISYWNRSITSAGINNGGRYPYNGTVSFETMNGTQYLRWTFAPNNLTFQYLNFNISTLAGLEGLSITLRGSLSGPTPLTAQVLFNQTEATVPSYVSNTSEDKASTTYSFYFPSATGPGAGSLPTNLGKITRVVIGLPRTGNQSVLLLSNLTGFSSGTGSFGIASGGEISVATGSNLTLTASPVVKIDTVTLVTGAVRGTSIPREDVYTSQSSPTSQSAQLRLDGWAIVQTSQVFSSEWAMTGYPGSALHIATNIGLNGWLVNLSGVVTLHFTYSGQALVTVGSIAELLGLSSIAGVLVVEKSRRGSRRLGGLRLVSNLAKDRARISTALRLPENHGRTVQGASRRVPSTSPEQH